MAFALGAVEPFGEQRGTGNESKVPADAEQEEGDDKPWSPV